MFLNFDPACRRQAFPIRQLADSRGLACGRQGGTLMSEN